MQQKKTFQAESVRNVIIINGAFLKSLPFFRFVKQTAIETRRARERTADIILHRFVIKMIE